MSNKKEDKPLSATTVKEILKQDYDTVKVLKEKLENNSSELSKKMIEKKTFSDQKDKNSPNK